MQNERTREVMLSFFVWMLAGFIIRVCLACSRPQHAVGFHYVFLFIHRLRFVIAQEGNSYFSFPASSGW